MSKFYGKIGFAVLTQKRPGVWIDAIEEKEYFGDIIKNTVSNKESNAINDELTISNEFSIIADFFANKNYSSIRYIEFNGIRWKVLNISVQYPRLVLSVGGVYNGE